MLAIPCLVAFLASSFCFLMTVWSDAHPLSIALLDERGINRRWCTHPQLTTTPKPPTINNSRNLKNLRMCGSGDASVVGDGDDRCWITPDDNDGAFDFSFCYYFCYNYCYHYWCYYCCPYRWCRIRSRGTRWKTGKIKWSTLLSSTSPS